MVNHVHMLRSNQMVQKPLRERGKRKKWDWNWIKNRLHYISSYCVMRVYFSFGQFFVCESISIVHLSIYVYFQSPLIYSTREWNGTTNFTKYSIIKIANILNISNWKAKPFSVELLTILEHKWQYANEIDRISVHKRFARLKIRTETLSSKRVIA